MAEASPGEERSPPALRLEVISGGRAGTSRRFTDPPVRIGRLPTSDLPLDPEEDATVSKEHAAVDRDVGGWFIRDLESRNGTLVNGDLLRTDRYLEDGDVVRLGPGGPRIRVRLGKSPTEAGAGGTAGSARRWTWWIPAALLATAVVAAAAGGVVIYRGVLSEGSGGSGDGAPEAAVLEQDSAARPLPGDGGRDGGSGDQARGAPDAAGGGGAAGPELAERLDSLSRALRASRRAIDSLEERLAEAEAGAGQREAGARSREELERELQSARAALRRQQLAADVDFEAIDRANWRALAQVYVEWPGDRVVTATAFAVRPSGVLVTAGHVVRGTEGEEPTRVAVQFSRSSQVWPASVVAASRTPDVALLRARRIAGEVPTVRAFNRRPDTLASGAPVVVMGFPLGGDAPRPGEEAGEDGVPAPPRPLVTLGLLSARSGRLLEFQGYGERGASGSPIFDADGRVVAVLLGGREDAGARNLLGVPVTAALSLLESREAGR